jgi:hypothetical protein
MDDRQAHARRALEDVCARGDLDAAGELYAPDFVDHVNRLEYRGQKGIAESVALYRAVFPDHGGRRGRPSAGGAAAS